MKIDAIQFKLSKNYSDDFILTITQENKTLGWAKYNYDENNNLHLRWIEVNENAQGKGIGNLILNKLFDNYCKNSGDFIIHVVDEEILNGFYLSWFSKRFDAEKQYEEQIIEKFNDSCQEDNESFLLIFKDEERDWKPSQKATFSY
ncbi:GNAT family N-acetyltransferase [Legionella israelensis]|uniref:GNAT family N-acetyltransferase n=1 Tax=Legionella israelensis TaxID=454 RepID=UPI00117C2B23|nr:GNAT family N-acetyltransferase [Legionella israelensis]QDP72688.1 GNAT family N-acetyltransferase [Legionella israelensis]